MAPGERLTAHRSRPSRRLLLLPAALLVALAVGCAASAAETEWLDMLVEWSDTQAECGTPPTPVAPGTTGDSTTCGRAVTLLEGLPRHCDRLRLDSDRCAEDMTHIREYTVGLIACKHSGTDLTDADATDRCLRERLPESNKFRPE